MVYKADMVEVVETLEAKLKRHEDALVACMAEITKLREENARLRSSENNAHSVLREVYNDPTASPAVRVKAAGLALSHESAPLKPVSQLELTAEPVEDLATLVHRRRRRQKALEGLDYQDPANAAKFLAWTEREDGTYPAEDDSGSNGSDDHS
jgi:hypothetical protein